MKTKKAQLSISSSLYEDFDEPPPFSITSERLQNVIEPSFELNYTGFAVSDNSLSFRDRNFPGVSLAQWTDWKWQIRNSYTSFSKLEKIINLSEDEKGFKEQSLNLPIRITPYYASLLDKYDELQPIRKTMIPVLDELLVSPGEESDPLNEEHDSPVPLIVHRYPDRALLLVTGFCSAFCRYCTRSHMVSKKDKMHASASEMDGAIAYISEHKEIRDVLISGGDPLTLSDERLEYILSRLRAIEHVEFVRIGTKIPAVLPMRITPALTQMLKKYHPVFMSLHFTHPSELTPETKEACNRLADAGIPLGSQTVLMKGINNSVEVFKKLTHELLKVRVRPYYLYQCDPIPGSAHFRTKVEDGLDIIRGLRGFTSGYAIPQFVIDAPKGGGKIPLLPDYFVGRENGDVLLRNYENKIFRYPDYT
ncbi:MAG: KamA family radical SAM protein [Bacteroidetes bacterium]|nr:KamA family radical SAM protein [Bacteroidota bacterium]MBL6943413.1 KamA family radical SAM protein [Bacteroidales bacterium]